MTVTFALIKERKTPPDRRVVFSPEKCLEIVKKYPNIRIIVESSDIRVFPDEEYQKLGFEVLDDVSEADGSRTWRGAGSRRCRRFGGIRRCDRATPGRGRANTVTRRPRPNLAGQRERATWAAISGFRSHDGV